MGTQYWLTIQCPYCEEIIGECYYTPMREPITWRCERCAEEFNIEDQFCAEEQAAYADEIAKDSKALEDLVASFGGEAFAKEPFAKEPFVPMPVISQLAIAIEETLIVYHEPHFIRWACRCLQRIVDKNFNPTEYMSDPEGSWANKAADLCVEAARQPILDSQIADAAVAIECALRAQDVAAKTKEKV